MKIDLQINQGSAPWPHVVEAVRAAEESGFDTVWVLDHFSGAMFDSESMLECFTCLGALAQATSRIRLGSLVANVVNRSAGLLAVASASIEAISGKRFTLGLGAGASPESAFSAEHRALGIELARSMAERHHRLVEVVETIRGMWTSDRPDDFAGFPVLEPSAPIIFGVNSVALASLAGAHADGMNVRASHPRWRECVASATAAHQNSSSVHDFDVSIWTFWDESLLDEDHPQRREWTEAGVTRMILVPRGTPDIGAIASAKVPS